MCFSEAKIGLMSFNILLSYNLNYTINSNSGYKSYNSKRSLVFFFHEDKGIYYKKKNKKKHTRIAITFIYIKLKHSYPYIIRVFLCENNLLKMIVVLSFSDAHG